jgi:hypothetical protein
MRGVSTYNEFRTAIAAVLQDAGAPAALVAHVAELGVEDTFAQPVFIAWECTCEGDELAVIVHDMTVELFAEWLDPMNHGPGAVPQHPAQGVVKLAQRVAELVHAREVGA